MKNAMADPQVRLEVRESYAYLEKFLRRLKLRNFPQTVGLTIEDMKKFEQAVQLLEVLMLDPEFKKERNRKAAYMVRWNYVKDNLERAKANPDAFADELKSSGMFCQTSARIDCRGSVREMIRRIELELGPRYLPHS